MRELDLSAHPEGGHFRELYRSPRPVEDRSRGGLGRTACTNIYFLLARGQVSRFHRVESDELWHFYEGEALELIIAEPLNGQHFRVTEQRLGPLSDGGRPFVPVPAGAWQAARPLGAYTLCGCTVAPGFEFEDFTLIDRQQHGALCEVLGGYPKLL